MIQTGSIFVYLFWIFGSLVVLFLVLLVFGSLYFKWYFSWELSHRRGLNYYGRPLEYRRDFRKKIKIHAFFLKPFIWIEAKLRKAKGTYEFASIKYKDVYGPSFSCSQKSFQKAADYQPSERDIFVVTQMRCGTTWMLQLIFQILTKGNGRFNDSGYVHLCAISPWLESLDNVSTEKAPLIGSSFKKIIKTHLPANLCPYDEAAILGLIIGRIYDNTSPTLLKHGRHPFNFNDRELLVNFATLRSNNFILASGQNEESIVLNINILLHVKKKNQYIGFFLSTNIPFFFPLHF